MKVTPQRQLLCALVAEARDHPTVEAIYARALERMSTISLKTVYSTLGELADLGLIRLSRLGAGSLQVDPDPTPHAHLVCKICDAVLDHPLDDDVAVRLSHAEGMGFRVEEQDVILRGRCAMCRDSPKRNGKTPRRGC